MNKTARSLKCIRISFKVKIDTVCDVFSVVYSRTHVLAEIY